MTPGLFQNQLIDRANPRNALNCPAVQMGHRETSGIEGIRTSISVNCAPSPCPTTGGSWRYRETEKGASFEGGGTSAGRVAKGSLHFRRLITAMRRRQRVRVRGNFRSRIAVTSGCRRRKAYRANRRGNLFSSVPSSQYSK